MFLTRLSSCLSFSRKTLSPIEAVESTFFFCAHCLRIFFIFTCLCHWFCSIFFSEKVDFRWLYTLYSAVGIEDDITERERHCGGVNETISRIYHLFMMNKRVYLHGPFYKLQIITYHIR